MLSTILSGFYERDLHKLIEEVRLFKHEENIWKTTGTVKNSCGNLVLHILGGTSYLIGATLAGTEYIRDRDAEFTTKGVEREVLITRLEALAQLVGKTIGSLSPGQLEAAYPREFDGAQRSVAYVLTQLALHLNYHLGQVNYLRRVME